MDTILLPSAGGLTGIFLANHFKKTRKCRIVATDLSPLNPLSQWVDSFSTMPPIQDPAYSPTLLTFCEKESVDYIFPVTSRDVDFFSLNENRLLFRAYPFLVMEEDFNRQLSNKKNVMPI